MAYKFKQGYYTPKNPEKYKGNLAKIVYRSSWEQTFNSFLDNNPNVLGWASEEIVIPYIKPTDNKVHRYFPDYWMMYQNKDGDIIQEIIEVKPSIQVRKPRSRKPKTRLIEDVTYAINNAKWEAATKWCEARGMLFRILTEKDLFK